MSTFDVKNLRGYNPHMCPDDDTVWSCTYSGKAREDFLHDCQVMGLTVKEHSPEHITAGRGADGGEWTAKYGGMLAWSV